MLGIIFGTLCLFGLVKLLRGSSRFGGGGHYGAPWHVGRGAFDRCPNEGYGWQEYAPGIASGFGRGRRTQPWGLRALFERLDTTPGQEKAIGIAFDQLKANQTVLRDELELTRADLSRALDAGFIDDTTLDETFARHDRLLAELRVSFVEAFKAASEALDDRQRKALAAFVARAGGYGGRSRWRGGDERAWV